MEQESNQMQTPPALCRSGCGFYGSPATDGLCSICYKEALKKKQQPPTSSPMVPSGRSSPGASPSSPIVSLNTAQPTVPVIPSEQVKEPLFSCRGSVISTSASGLDVSWSTSANFQKSEEEEEEEEGGEAAGASSEAADGADAKAGSSLTRETEKDGKKKNRCATCRKKIGLTGFECRCGGLFCAVHRYSDKHDCTFNYRELGAEEIRKNNPVVMGEKIQKI